MGSYHLTREEILYNICELHKLYKNLLKDKEKKFGVFSEERRIAFAVFDAVSMIRLKVDNEYSQDEFKVDLFGK
jgi:hypothetical protein